MTHSILQHLRDALLKNSVHRTDKLLVAVSGGVDSMVLLEHCRQLQLTMIVAHVNYGLRGEESKKDEQLVLEYCNTHQIPCETLRVEPSHWQHHKGSTQAIARAIRYDWFEQLRSKHGARYTLTAHHANDQTETMLMQFIRGGGGKSVYGMPELHKGLLRPLLAVSRKTIQRYAEEYTVPWRDDQSNNTDAYTRNFIRHHILPLVEQLNPEIHDTIQLRSRWMHEEQHLMNIATEAFFARHLREEGNRQMVSIRSLLESGAMQVLMWKWLGMHGFTSAQVTGIERCACEEARSEAARFSSATHDVWVQHDSIVCIPKELSVEYTIDTWPCVFAGVHFESCAVEEVVFGVDAEKQYIDSSLLQLPLWLRPWRAGDRFFPLGAKGEQKISDFLTHAKIPTWQKSSVYVLESGNTIAAVVGLRISEKFKITHQTTHCLRLRISRA